MKFLTLILFSFFFIENCCAQPGWFQQTSGTSLDLNTACFLNSSTGIAAANGGVFLKTTNGGTNWFTINSGFNYSTTALAFPTSSNILAGIVGLQNKILRSTDGGTSWDTSSSISGWCFSFINNSTGFCVAGNAVFKTTSAGISWVLASGGLTTNVIRAIHFINENTGYTCGTWWSMSLNVYNSIVFKSTNGGTAWDMSYSGPVNSSYITMFDIDFMNEQYGFALESPTNKLFRTVNSGQNWLGQQLSYSGINSVDFVNFNNGWLCGNGGVILYSSDGGNNFVTQQSPVFFNLKKVFMVNQSTGWIVGSNGTILKTTNGGISGLEVIGNFIPGEYRLFQNYPNPFNPVSIIEFQIPDLSGVSLTVFDPSGKLIGTLVNERLGPGKYKIRFDGTSHPSGVYFCRLAAGNYVDVKKMILLK